MRANNEGQLVKHVWTDWNQIPKGKGKCRRAKRLQFAKLWSWICGNAYWQPFNTRISNSVSDAAVVDLMYTADGKKNNQQIFSFQFLGQFRELWRNV